MGLFLVRLLFTMYWFACTYQTKGQWNKNPELEWENMATITGGASSETIPKLFRSGSPSLTYNSEFVVLPEYFDVSSAKDQKALFKPERGARPLPSSLTDIMFPTTTEASLVESSAQPKLVEILCHIDRIYVRVRRDAFKTLDAYKYLKLGTCPVNQGTQDHYYFLYYLTADCDFRKKSNVDDLTVKNTVHYLPTTAVLREMPFDIPVQCKYQRLLHSYKVGIWPKIQGGTMFKSLKRKITFLLIPQDESGNVMTKPYVMGQPMFFEAKRTDGTPRSRDRRLYIQKCFMTSSHNPTSTRSYTVIDNFGCMIDGKVSAESMFLPGSSSTQRFTLSAVVLTNIASSSTIKQLYMHCDLSFGKQTPTKSLKACNYDPATRKWNELYGDHSVCTCCDSSCSPPHQLRASRLVTSQPWKVDFKEEYDEDSLKMKTLGTGHGFEDHAEEEMTDIGHEWEDDF